MTTPNGKQHEKITEIWVVGLGGVGFWLAAVLARESTGRKVIGFDDDTFEGGNGFRRLPRVSDPKMLKTDRLKGFIALTMGDQPIETVNRRLTPEYIEEQGIDDLSNVLVVDCTDMGLAARGPLWDGLISLGAMRLRVSYDGNGTVVVARGLPLGEPVAGGGYEMIPTLAQSLTAGGLGAQAVHKLLNGHEVTDFQITI